MTSSASPTPAAIMAQWSPAVPEETPMPCFRPADLAQTRSNSSIFGPIESVCPSSTSTTASISRRVTSGRERGIVDIDITKRSTDQRRQARPLRRQRVFALSVHRTPQHEPQAWLGIHRGACRFPDSFAAKSFRWRYDEGWSGRRRQGPRHMIRPPPFEQARQVFVATPALPCPDTSRSAVISPWAAPPGLRAIICPVSRRA